MFQITLVLRGLHFTSRACSKSNIIQLKLMQSQKTSPIVGSMLGHRLRRWLNIGPAMGQCLVFSRIVSGRSSVDRLINAYFL